MPIFAMAVEGQIFLGLCAVTLVLLAIASVLEEANKGRKAKQREKEWEDLNKP